MADDQLDELFASGTAPERDAAFAQRVDARIASERRSARFLALAIRTLPILLLAAAVYVTVRLAEPALQQIAGNWPQFMGVPVPLILAALGIGLAVRFQKFIGLRLG